MDLRSQLANEDIELRRENISGEQSDVTDAAELCCDAGVQLSASLNSFTDEHDDDELVEFVERVFRLHEASGTRGEL